MSRVHECGNLLSEPSVRAVLMHQRDVTERKQAKTALRDSERRYRNIFESAGVSIWEEDFSEVKAAIESLKAQGVGDFREYIAAHPEFVRQAVAMVKIVDVNDATVKLFGATSKEDLLRSLHTVFTPETEKVFAEELVAIAEEWTSFASEVTLRTLKGENSPSYSRWPSRRSPQGSTACW